MISCSPTEDDKYTLGAELDWRPNGCCVATQPLGGSQTDPSPKCMQRDPCISDTRGPASPSSPPQASPLMFRQPVRIHSTHFTEITLETGLSNQGGILQWYKIIWSCWGGDSHTGFSFAPLPCHGDPACTETPQIPFFSAVHCCSAAVYQYLSLKGHVINTETEKGK